MEDRWEECQELIEYYFGDRPETPQELIEIMTAMADMVLEAQGKLKTDRKMMS